MNAEPGWDAFAAKKYLSLETYRKTGAGVRTPVWFALSTLQTRCGSRDGPPARVKHRCLRRNAPAANDRRGQTGRIAIMTRSCFTNSRTKTSMTGFNGQYLRLSKRMPRS